MQPVPGAPPLLQKLPRAHDGLVCCSVGMIAVWLSSATADVMASSRLPPELMTRDVCSKVSKGIRWLATPQHLCCLRHWLD